MHTMPLALLAALLAAAGSGLALVETVGVLATAGQDATDAALAGSPDGVAAAAGDVASHGRYVAHNLQTVATWVAANPDSAGAEVAVIAGALTDAPLGLAGGYRAYLWQEAHERPAQLGAALVLMAGQPHAACGQVQRYADGPWVAACHGAAGSWAEATGDEVDFGAAMEVFAIAFAAEAALLGGLPDL